MKGLKIALILEIIALIFVIVLTSCRTVPKESSLNWSSFPSPYDAEGVAVVTYNDNDTVTMPMWYWRKIVNYVVDTETNIKILESK